MRGKSLVHHTDTDRQLALRGCRRIHQMHERQGDPLHATSRIANLVCRSSIPRARFRFFFDFSHLRSISGARGRFAARRRRVSCADSRPSGLLNAPFRCRFSGLNSPSWWLPGYFHGQRACQPKQPGRKRRSLVDAVPWLSPQRWCLKIRQQ